MVPPQAVAANFRAQIWLCCKITISLDQTCSSMTILMCTKQAPWTHVLLMLDWKNLSWPNPTVHHWEELEHDMHPIPPHLTSAPDLTTALVYKWSHIPTVMLYHLVESYYKSKRKNYKTLLISRVCVFFNIVMNSIKVSTSPSANSFWLKKGFFAFHVCIFYPHVLVVKMLSRKKKKSLSHENLTCGSVA